MSRTSPVALAAPRLAQRAADERRARRRRLLRRTGTGVAVSVPVAAVGWVLLGSSLLGVQRLTVTGEHRLTQADVVAAAHVTDGTPLARLDISAVRRRIAALPAVESVTVSRSWPHTLRITVVERRPVVALVHGGAFELVDRAGVILADASAVPHGVVKLESSSTQATSAALRVLLGLPHALAARLGEVRAPTPEQVTLVLTDGRTVLWGGPVDGPTKASAVLALLHLPGTVFDVSAPGVATRR
jgi:cell division protein FtsQ